MIPLDQSSSFAARSLQEIKPLVGCHLAAIELPLL